MKLLLLSMLASGSSLFLFGDTHNVLLAFLTGGVAMSPVVLGLNMYFYRKTA